MEENGDEEGIQLTINDSGFIQDVHAVDNTSEDADALEMLPDMTQFLLDEDNNGLTSYDLISRTLHQLARDGNSTSLSAALARLGDQCAKRINELDSDKLSPLHYAARYSQPGAITALLHAGADVNIKGQDNLTPLHCAARYRKSIKSGRFRRSSHTPETLMVGNEEEQGEEGGSRNDLTVTSMSSLGDRGKFGKPSEDSVVRLLVENGADINACDVYDLTPLHFAAMRGNDVALRDLLAYPMVDVEARDKQLMTPLFLSTIYGYPDTVRQLLLAGAQILMRDDEFQTPMHKAAAEGHLEIVKLLLRNYRDKADKTEMEKLLSSKDAERMTPLYFAVANGHYEVTKRLLTAGSDPNSIRDTMATPLHAAAMTGSEELIDLLIEHGSRVNSVDAYQQTPLHRAASYNMGAAIRTLLRHGANIDRRDRNSFTPLLLAVSAGHSAATSVLLLEGADVTVCDKDDKTVVFWCAAEGNVKTLHILLKDVRCLEMIDISDRSDNSPLHEAAKRGYVKTVSALLDAGSQIDNKNEDEETALHIAAEEGRVRVVQELIKRYRYLLNDENEDSDTPLHLASLKGHNVVVKCLLDAGADVEARNTSLWTPLDCASFEGHVQCCLLLLEYDSPLDPIDKRRTTPLQLAGRGGHTDVVQKLLEKGASLSVCDATGKNALEVAISAGRKEVVMAMLKSSQWLEALRHCRVTTKGRRVTPFRMMVKRFPEAAEFVLDRCTTANGLDPDNNDFGIKFNFEFLEDTYEILEKDTVSVDLLGKSFVPNNSYDEFGELKEESHIYTYDMRELKRNHPLMLMVKHRRSNLLGHPVSVALVKHKWMTSGRFFYYFNLLFYFVFITFLTGYVLHAPDWASVNSMLNNTASSYGANSDSYQQSCEAAQDELHITRHFFVSVGKWAILVLALLNIVRELFQMYQSRLNYLGIENLMEWICYVCAVVLVWDFSPTCIIRERWQWQVGTCAIFLSWLILLLFIRKFPFFGIYVVMFTDILATFSKFFIVFFLFIIAFALAFYTVLKTQTSFSTPGGALLKTAVMMIGEFEFDSIFNDPEFPLPYPEVTFPLFVAFLILMSIIIMNLLVGLAVDDIKAVQEQAVMKRLGMQTQLVLDVETLLPDFLRRISSKSFKIVHPNARHSPFSKLFGDFKILRSFQFLSASEEGFSLDPRVTERLLSDEMSETERLSQSVADLNVQVEELRTQNVRTHALLTSLLAFMHEKEDKEESEEIDSTEENEEGSKNNDN